MVKRLVQLRGRYQSILNVGKEWSKLSSAIAWAAVWRSVEWFILDLYRYAREGSDERGQFASSVAIGNIIYLEGKDILATVNLPQWHVRLGHPLLFSSSIYQGNGLFKIGQSALRFTANSLP